ncbi:MAG: CBS domain-containing protein [Pseudomonadota bacterium]
MRLVRHLLEEKGGSVVAISPDDTVLEAIKVMAEKSVGALLVLDGDTLVGIVSERDYARKVILRGRASDSTRVRDIMTSELITARSDDSVRKCMNTMTEHRIRHLPVVDEELSGIISIGDLVAAIIADQQEEIAQLEQYISS